MSNVPRKWTNVIKLETRALAIHGELRVFSVSGKGLNSGWSKVREGLEALGFRITSADAAEDEADAGRVPQEQP